MTSPATPQRLVLVVDDDPVSLLVTSHILEAGGFAVSRASSAAEARAVLREAADRIPVSLIVCDHLMPDETGLELLAGLNQIDAPTARFILLTGVSSEEDLDDPRTARVDAFLTKPVQSSTLLEAAQAALNAGASTE